MTRDFLYLSDDLILRSGYFSASRMWHDAEGTVVITSSLDYDIGTCRIFLELFHTEILIPLRVVSYFFVRNQGKYLCHECNLFDTESEVDERRAEEELIIIVRYTFG